MFDCFKHPYTCIYNITLIHVNPCFCNILLITIYHNRYVCTKSVIKNPRLASRGNSFVLKSNLLGAATSTKTGAAILSYLFTSFHFIYIFL